MFKLFVLLLKITTGQLVRELLDCPHASRSAGLLDCQIARLATIQAKRERRGCAIEIYCMMYSSREYLEYYLNQRLEQIYNQNIRNLNYIYISGYYRTVYVSLPHKLYKYTNSISGISWATTRGGLSAAILLYRCIIFFCIT